MPQVSSLSRMIPIFYKHTQINCSFKKKNYPYILFAFIFSYPRIYAFCVRLMAMNFIYLHR